jgi:hypothetical protein
LVALAEEGRSAARVRFGVLLGPLSLRLMAAGRSGLARGPLASLALLDPTALLVSLALLDPMVPLASPALLDPTVLLDPTALPAPPALLDPTVLLDPTALPAPPALTWAPLPFAPVRMRCRYTLAPVPAAPGSTCT